MRSLPKRLGMDFQESLDGFKKSFEDDFRRSKGEPSKLSNLKQYTPNKGFQFPT